jgi:VIT1/CCC1 family predicted Fe2+/Mn2+ transporter
MKHSSKTGLTFGLTSGTITTLGLMVGLHSGTHSKLAVIGGILTIAIADAFSDALGIHMCEEGENVHSAKEIWESTIVTFAAKFFFALTFLVPLLLLWDLPTVPVPLLQQLPTAILVSIAYGLTILGIASYVDARQRGVKSWKVIVEHLLIAGLVIVITHFVGDWIRSTFGERG